MCVSCDRCQDGGVSRRRRKAPLRPLAARQELLAKIGAGMVRAAGRAGWKRLELEISGADQRLKGAILVVREDGTDEGSLDRDTTRACHDLREVMYEADTGTWYAASLVVDDEHVLEAEFDYESRPPAAETDQALHLDHRRYPRSEEHLPSWHPAKARPPG